jgi:K+-sensing histidine kinase KdpD
LPVRTSRSTSAAGRGAPAAWPVGLGLAIVRQLLIADGGSIELRPASGAGLDVVVRVRATEPV